MKILSYVRRKFLVLLVASGYNIPDGMLLNPMPVYTSADAGMTWIQTTAPIGLWKSVASSADGRRLLAASADPWAQGTGSLYISEDSGATWTQTSAPPKDWTAVASSADGTKLLAAVGLDHGDGSIFVSSDSG